MIPFTKSLPNSQQRTALPGRGSPEGRKQSLLVALPVTPSEGVQRHPVQISEAAQHVDRGKRVPPLNFRQLAALDSNSQSCHSLRLIQPCPLSEFSQAKAKGYWIDGQALALLNNSSNKLPKIINDFAGVCVPCRQNATKQECFCWSRSVRSNETFQRQTTISFRAFYTVDFDRPLGWRLRPTRILQANIVVQRICQLVNRFWHVSDFFQVCRAFQQENQSPPDIRVTIGFHHCDSLFCLFRGSPGFGDFPNPILPMLFSAHAQIPLILNGAVPVSASHAATGQNDNRPLTSKMEGIAPMPTPQQETR